MIFDHYLMLRLWITNFISSATKIKKTLVRNHFLGFNPFYCDESILLALTATKGKPIKVDNNTKDARRVPFACVCSKLI